MNITPISTTNKTSNHQINFSSKKIDGKKVFEELSSLYNQTEKLFKDDKAHQGLDWTKNTYFDFQVFYKNINPRKTSVVLGDKEKILFGPGYISDYLCGLKFDITSKSFGT